MELGSGWLGILDLRAAKDEGGVQRSTQSLQDIHRFGHTFEDGIFEQVQGSYKTRDSGLNYKLNLKPLWI